MTIQREHQGDLMNMPADTLPPPCGWARIGLRNGRAYIADTYTRNPYPPPADVAERLNVVPVHDEPTVRRLLAEQSERIRVLTRERDEARRIVQHFYAVMDPWSDHG